MLVSCERVVTLLLRVTIKLYGCCTNCSKYHHRGLYTLIKSSDFPLRSRKGAEFILKMLFPETEKFFYKFIFFKMKFYGKNIKRKIETHGQGLSLMVKAKPVDIIAGQQS